MLCTRRVCFECTEWSNEKIEKRSKKKVSQWCCSNKLQYFNVYICHTLFHTSMFIFFCVLQSNCSSDCQWKDKRETENKMANLRTKMKKKHKHTKYEVHGNHHSLREIYYVCITFALNVSRTNARCASKCVLFPKKKKRKKKQKLCRTPWPWYGV